MRQQMKPCCPHDPETSPRLLPSPSNSLSPSAWLIPGDPVPSPVPSSSRFSHLPGSNSNRFQLLSGSNYNWFSNSNRVVIRFSNGNPIETSPGNLETLL